MKNSKITVDADTIHISTIKTVLVDLPGIRPHRHSKAGMSHQSYVIILIETDAGITGVGEVATPGGPWWSGDSVEAVKAVIDTYLAPALLGQCATRTAHLLSLCDKLVAGNWFAKAGLEMALYDILAKSVSLPVHAFLGGAYRDSIPITWPLGQNDASADIDEALKKIDQGISRSFKIKMGSLPVDQDVRRTLEIAKALSGHAQLRVDLNAAWTETTAQKHLQSLAEAGIELIEQPIESWNLPGHARLARRFNVPLMADESLSSRRDALSLASQASVQVFALKLMKSGGIAACMDIAAIASASGINIYGGCFLESSVGTAANLQLGAALPEMPWGSEWIGPLWLADDLVINPVEYVDYSIRVPRLPGLGIELDLEKVAFYRRDKNPIVAIAPMVLNTDKKP